MVTSVTSSTTSLANPTGSPAKSPTASAKSAAQSLITSLGSGSGVDINSLANNLVEAERAPQKAAIQAKIDKSNATNSGYSALRFVLDNLRTAFGELKDKSAFTTNTANNSQPAAFSADVTGADAGNHTIQVFSLAKPQISVSGSFDSDTRNLNGGNSFSIDVTVKGITIPVTFEAGKTSLTEIAKKISSATGLKASVIKVSDGPLPYKIGVTGATGLNNAFSFGANTLGFGAPTQDAIDADLTVDGVPISSSTNVIKGAINGITLTLLGETNQSASLDVSRDISSVKTKVQALVSAYNDTLSMLGVVSDPKSTVETYGATLVGNSTVGTIRGQIRGMIVGPSNTPSGKLTALRDLGITVEKSGQLSLDNAKLTSSLQNNYDDVINMLSGKVVTGNTISYGVARASFDTLDQVLNPIGGTLQSLTNNQNTKITTYQKQLDALETRMQVLLKRYTEQFSAMDSLVGQIKSTQTGLKSAFDGMMATYTNK